MTVLLLVVLCLSYLLVRSKRTQSQAVYEHMANERSMSMIEANHDDDVDVYDQISLNSCADNYEQFPMEEPTAQEPKLSAGYTTLHASVDKAPSTGLKSEEKCEYFPMDGTAKIEDPKDEDEGEQVLPGEEPDDKEEHGHEDAKDVNDNHDYLQLM